MITGITVIGRYRGRGYPLSAGRRGYYDRRVAAGGGYFSFSRFWVNGSSSLSTDIWTRLFCCRRRRRRHPPNPVRRTQAERAIVFLFRPDDICITQYAGTCSWPYANPSCGFRVQTPSKNKNGQIPRKRIYIDSPKTSKIRDARIEKKKKSNYYFRAIIISFFKLAQLNGMAKSNSHARDFRQINSTINNNNNSDYYKSKFFVFFFFIIMFISLKRRRWCLPVFSNSFSSYTKNSTIIVKTLKLWQQECEKLLIAAFSNFNTRLIVKFLINRIMVSILPSRL